MNDQQLARNLQSVGKKFFVTYFCTLFDLSIDSRDIVKQLGQDRPDYTAKSRRSRVSHARAIVKAGRARDALIDISQSAKLEVQITDKARNMVEKLRTMR